MYVALKKLMVSYLYTNRILISNVLQNRRGNSFKLNQKVRVPDDHKTGN